MKDNQSAAYYLSRAEQEEAAALAASSALAANIHRNLADRYRVKAAGFPDERRLTLVRD